MTESIYDVIILGSGPAGLTSAIYTSRGGLKTLVLTGDQPGGQPTITDVVENFPGFPEGIKGPELMERIKEQAAQFGAVTEFDAAVEVKPSRIVLDRERKSTVGYEVETRQGEKYLAKSIIIAVGASPRWLDVPGADKFKGRGVSVCATCDGPFFQDKTVAVVGGGDTALTEAEFLAKFANQVYLIHRRENFRAQAILQDRIAKNDKIVTLYNSTVKEFFGQGKLEGITIESQYQVNSDIRQSEVKGYAEDYGQQVLDKNGDKALWKLNLEGIFLAIGYVPNTSFLKGFVKLNDKGYVKTDRDVFTSVDGVFAAGDCVDYRYRQNIVSCGMGCKAALEVEKFLNAIT
jgi:thioredoxin reductase (NADPH)